MLSVIEKEIGVKFDKELQYINDIGIKKVGYCYLDKNVDGVFECIKQTSVVFNDSSCFTKLSIKENSDRLSKLTEVFDSEGHLTYPNGTKEWIE